MSFSVIHLTDIHLNDSDNIVISRTNELIDACRSELAKTDDVIIVISGDIANTGSDSEYEIAFDFISNIQAELNDYLITPVKILSVPGNHDCHHLANVFLIYFAFCVLEQTIHLRFQPHIHTFEQLYTKLEFF